MQAGRVAAQEKDGSGRGRMRADRSPLRQLPVLRYQSIGRRLRVSVYSVASGAICKSEFPRPNLFIRATEFTQVKRRTLYFA